MELAQLVLVQLVQQLQLVLVELVKLFHQLTLMDQVQIVLLELQLINGVQSDMVNMTFLMMVINLNVLYVTQNVKLVINKLLLLDLLLLNVVLVMILVLLLPLIPVLLEQKTNLYFNLLVGSKNAQLVMSPTLLEMLVLNVVNHVNYVPQVPQTLVLDVLMDIS